jgi:galactokinase
MNSALIERVLSGHKEKFATAPAALAYAPGRIEVLGNHTDYNEGFVLSAAIDAGICVAISPNSGKRCVLSALDAGETVEFDLPVNKPLEKPHWANYLVGVTSLLSREGRIDRGFCLTFAGDVPQGAGLSSSAALEVATALALIDLMQKSNFNPGRAGQPVPPAGSGGQGCQPLPPRSLGSNSSFDRIQLARLCQKAENEYTGAKCGLLDQISSLYGMEHSLIFTDFRSLAVENDPIGKDTCFLMANTRVKHNLVESDYNERRASCEKAAEYFASVLPHPVKALRDVSAEELKKYSAGLDPVILKRAKHIVGENERTLKARQLLRAGKTKEFGALMYESHESSRLNFENSCEELDFIVETASGLKEVLGARLSGGGFGGSAVLLVHPDRAGQTGAMISSAYARRFGAACEVKVIKPSAGAIVLPEKNWKPADE